MNFVPLTHREGPGSEEGGDIGSFCHVPINLIDAAVLSAIQYLSVRWMQAAVLDFGNVAPG